ncbi:MAG: anthranilate synthase component I [Gammaproteobacteria bacterium]|nr:anthranilate synthase component I [Gammaproteobacteria bacterium]
MTPAQFDQLSLEGYNRIPVSRQVFADFDTPLSVYLKVVDGARSYLLESVQGGETWGRYSVIGLPCRKAIVVEGDEVRLLDGEQIVEAEKSDDPLDWIEHYLARYRVPEMPDLPRFSGGLVGYFGYDTVRYIEPKLAKTSNPDRLNTPDIMLLVSEEVIVFDNLSNRVTLICYADSDGADAHARAEQRLDELQARLLKTVKRPLIPVSAGRDLEDKLESNMSREAFEAIVVRAKEYIDAGDVMQVVLSQCLSIPCNSDPLDLYRVLRSLNPSPYMYFFNLGDFHIVGSSPEILTRLDGNEVTVRPIAGTRRRGRDAAEDKALEDELLADPKELAEHLMLIDLGRNDVGRVARTGTVNLTERMVVERYSHVMHIVSNVVGELREGLTAIDVLRACFPAGTVSGAPKVRAMEIIAELEPTKRGPYAGAVGYLGWNGAMDTAIAIRTAVIKDGRFYIQVGAGIVADSDPASEWEETMNKGRALFRAISILECNT